MNSTNNSFLELNPDEEDEIAAFIASDMDASAFGGDSSEDDFGSLIASMPDEIRLIFSEYQRKSGVSADDPMIDFLAVTAKIMTHISERASQKKAHTDLISANSSEQIELICEKLDDMSLRIITGISGHMPDLLMNIIERQAVDADKNRAIVRDEIRDLADKIRPEISASIGAALSLQLEKLTGGVGRGFIGRGDWIGWGIAFAVGVWIGRVF